MTLVVAIICPSMSVLWHSKCERGGKRGRRVRHTKGVCSATRGGGEGGWRDPVATLLHLAYCTEEWVVKQQPSFLQTSCAFPILCLLQRKSGTIGSWPFLKHLIKRVEFLPIRRVEFLKFWKYYVHKPRHNGSRSLITRIFGWTRGISTNWIPMCTLFTVT